MIINTTTTTPPPSTVKGTINSARYAIFFTYVDINGEFHENLGSGIYDVPKNSICLIDGDRNPTITGDAEPINGYAYFITGDFSAII